MTSNNSPHGSPPAESDLAQAFKDLAKGERTALAMENQLTSLERKIDDLLASVDSKASDEQVEGKLTEKDGPT
ncbi:hypothetical protein MMC14_009471 [Varicellaria rhodocarpa]|nr:hypothetical protein [Varicellaria rhodocarpa]